MFDYQDLKKAILNPDLSEAALERGISKLRLFYTEKRSELRSLVFDRDLTSAYTLFYMTTNMAKLPFVLNKLNPSIRNEILESDIIDFGCGPGTFAWSLEMEYGPLFKSYMGIDCQVSMLDAAKKIEKSFYPDSKKFIFLDHLTSLKKSLKFRTLVFSHSMNEMSIPEFEEIIGQVNPKFLIFIEPGTSEVFAKMIEWRKVQSKYLPLYPCQSPALTCPMVEEDWCHQVIRQSFDPELERTSQRLKIDRRTQTLIAHVYALNANELLISDSKHPIILRFYKETKFSYIYFICEKNEIKKVELLKKDLKGRKDLTERLAPGQFINYELIKELDLNYLRIKLIETS